MQVGVTPSNGLIIDTSGVQGALTAAVKKAWAKLENLASLLFSRLQALFAPKPKEEAPTLAKRTVTYNPGISSNIKTVTPPSFGKNTTSLTVDTSTPKSSHKIDENGRQSHNNTFAKRQEREKMKGTGKPTMLIVGGTGTVLTGIRY